ncbi:MAG: hypothetical protein NUW37_10720 [Planctomycetes bacterium]|nr:hypothetical protein [Planctomycetota bacterium]
MKKSLCALLTMLLVLPFVQSANAQEQAAEEEKEKERVIYVPYDELREVFGQGERGVYLPFAEYQNLWERAHAAELGPEVRRDPPAPAIVHSVDYIAEVKESVVVVVAEFNISTLVDGFVEIPMPVTNAAISKAVFKEAGSNEEKRADFYPSSDGGFTLLLSGGKDGLLRLELSVPVVTTDVSPTLRRYSAKFGCPRSPLAKLDFKLPFANTRPSCAAAIASERKDDKVSFFLKATSEIELVWESYHHVETPRASRFNAEACGNYLFREGNVTLFYQVEVTIPDGYMDELTIQIPAEGDVREVRGPSGNSNEVRGEGAQRVLHLGWQQKIEQKFSVSFELGFQGEAIIGKRILPSVRVVGAEQERGTLICSVAMPYRLVSHLEAETVRDLVRQIDLGEAIRAVNGKVPTDNARLGFRYERHPFEIEVEVQRIIPRVRITNSQTITFEETVQSMNSEMNVSVEELGIRQLAVTIPEGYDVRRLQAAMGGRNLPLGRWVVEEKTDELSRRLLIDLGDERIGAFSVSLTLEKVISDEEGADPGAERTVKLPLVFVPGIFHESGTVAVLVRKSLELRIEASSLTNLLVLDVSELPQHRGRGTPVPVSQTLMQAYIYHQTPISAEGKLKKKPAMVTCRVLTDVSVTEESIRHELMLNYNVEFTGVKEFVFDVKASFADSVLPANPAISWKKEKVADAENTFRFTVNFPSNQEGAVSLVFKYERPLPAMQSGESQAFDLAEITVRGNNNVKEGVKGPGYDLSRESGWIRIRKSPNFALKFQKAEVNLEPIDPRELPTEFAAEDILFALRYTEHPFSPKMNVSRQLFAEVQNIVIDELVLITDVTRDFEAHSTAHVRLQNNTGQYVKVTLPKGAELSKVTVDGKEERWSSDPADENAKLISLPRQVSPDTPIEVSMQYRSKLSGGEETMEGWGSFELQGPKFGEVPVNVFKWTVFLPEEFEYFDFDTDMSHESERPRPVWYLIKKQLGSGAGLNVGIQRDRLGSYAFYYDDPFGHIRGEDHPGRMEYFRDFTGRGTVRITYIEPAYHAGIDYSVAIVLFLALLLVPIFWKVNRVTLTLGAAVVSLLLASMITSLAADYFVSASLASIVMLALLVIMSIWDGIKLWISRPRKEKPATEVKTETAATPAAEPPPAQA